MLNDSPHITMAEAKDYVVRQIKAQGLVPAEPELDGRFWFVRIKTEKGQAIGIVTISPYVVDADKDHAESALKSQVLEAIRAGLKEPILKATGNG